MPASRSHIVAPLKDHLKPEGAFEKSSEVHSQYRNLSPSRPVIHKLKDHLKPEGDFSSKSETSAVYKDNHATRPVIHKLRDHSADVQPEGNLEKKYVINSLIALAVKSHDYWFVVHSLSLLYTARSTEPTLPRPWQDNAPNQLGFPILRRSLLSKIIIIITNSRRPYHYHQKSYFTKESSPLRTNIHY